MSQNYISPAMLPLGSIAEYMDKVEGFSKKKESAEDTKQVNGIKSDLIAIAATDENGELIEDRETVKNALKLGGIPAKDYVTTEGANALLSDTYQVSVNSGNETKNLRECKKEYDLIFRLIKDCIRSNKELQEKLLLRPLTIASTVVAECYLYKIIYS